MCTISVFRVENEYNTYRIEKKDYKKEKRYEGKDLTMNCSKKVRKLLIKFMKTFTDLNIFIL